MVVLKSDHLVMKRPGGLAELEKSESCYYFLR